MKLFRTALIASFFSLSLMAGGSHGGGGVRGGGFSGGGYRGGYGHGGGYARGYYGGYRGWYGGWGFGMGYPYYWGGYYYPYYSPYYYDPYYYAPAYTTAPAYVSTPAPAVQSGSYYRSADFYLIAFTDHNIKAAQSCKIVGDQIEWTPREGGDAMRAPLSSVDKRFTAQINRDRRVKLELPLRAPRFGMTFESGRFSSSCFDELGLGAPTMARTRTVPAD